MILNQFISCYDRKLMQCDVHSENNGSELLGTFHYLPDHDIYLRFWHSKESCITTDWIVLNMPCDYSFRGELKRILFGPREESLNRRVAL